MDITGISLEKSENCGSDVVTFSVYESSICTHLKRHPMDLRLDRKCDMCTVLDAGGVWKA